VQVMIGFDPREAAAFAVTRASLWRHLDPGVPVHGLVLDDLRARGLYRRPTRTKLGRMWDDISGAYCATQFAISRFLVPYLCGYRGWALFMDCDMLVRAPMAELFALRDDSKAVMCVQHDYAPAEGEKMDGQAQQLYACKNWSSLMLFNCGHPANAELTVDLVNSLPGRDLHRFCWLKDEQLGELPKAWNHLIGEYPPDPAAKIAHFTLGGPWFAGFEQAEFADEWRAVLHRWAAA